MIWLRVSQARTYECGAYSVAGARLLDGRIAPIAARISRMARSVLPDPFYYLNNFRAVLVSLEARYADVLSARERQFMADFTRLPIPSCALIVRMIMRKGEFFRLSRLSYPEIGDTVAAAAPLWDVGWLDQPVLDVGELHGLLAKDELIRYFPVLRSLGRLGKPALLEVLREQYPDSRPFEAWCGNFPDRVLHPTIKPLAENFRLMFFGNFHQDWTEFVLKDLGINTYETMPGYSAPFRTREHIDGFHELYRCRLALDDGGDLQQVREALPPAIADCDWLEDVRQRLLFQVATAFERAGNVSSAITVLSTCRHRGARMRAVRLLERQKEWQAARDLAVAAEDHPESEAERQQLRRVLPRLNRKLNVAQDKPAVPAVATFELQLDAVEINRPVEIVVRNTLAGAHPDSTVHYVENGLVNSLFGLLCWPAIFAPIPGAFFHDFQTGPADLESGRFYERRRAEFAACFAELASGQYQESIRERFHTKAGIASPFVNWGLMTERLLNGALLCFPAPHLRLWFEWIVRDVIDNRSGFPDLVQFWPKQRRYRWIEVKGPNDRLQDNQRRFHEFCAGHAMPVMVCRVSYTGALGSLESR